MLYTGYERAEFPSIPYAKQILEYVDILVAGRYQQYLRNTSLQWRGSENQEVGYLSDRYN